MLRIRVMFDGTSEAEQRRLSQVQEIFKLAFPEHPGEEEDLARLVRSRGTPAYEATLLTLESERGEVGGFAFVHLYAETRYAFLDFIAAHPKRRAQGVGGALYEAVRELTAQRGARGLFMEVSSDERAHVSDPSKLPQNRRRLAFYERFGALPIVGTHYGEPPRTGPSFEPYLLLYDPLGRPPRLSRSDLRRMAASILVEKYRFAPDSEHVKRIVGSIRDNPVRQRPARYAEQGAFQAPTHGRLHPLKILVAPHHEIHHVRDRGYEERQVGS